MNKETVDFDPDDATECFCGHSFGFSFAVYFEDGAPKPEYMGLIAIHCPDCDHNMVARLDGGGTASVEKS